MHLAGLAGRGLQDGIVGIAGRVARLGGEGREAIERLARVAAEGVAGPRRDLGRCGRGVDGHVHELWWSTAGWHHNDLTAAASAPTLAAQGSSPACYAFESILFQPTATQHVVYAGTDSLLHELWWSAGAWHVNDIAARVGAPPVVGDADAFVEVDDGTQNVFYLSDAHQIIELRWRP